MPRAESFGKVFVLRPTNCIILPVGDATAEMPARHFGGKLVKGDGCAGRYRDVGASRRAAMKIFAGHGLLHSLPVEDGSSPVGTMDNPKEKRLAWAISGSGHYLRECLEIIRGLERVDLFLSAAAAEVLRMYGHDLAALRAQMRVYSDSTASSVPVEFLYQGNYHTVVVAPATSNTVAKMVWGISDTLVTNMYAQAGKCRVQSIVFACDNEPEIDSEAPKGMVKVYPRRIDLENVERLKEFEATTVVADMPALRQALKDRLDWLSTSSS